MGAREDRKRAEERKKAILLGLVALYNQRTWLLFWRPYTRARVCTFLLHHTCAHACVSNTTRTIVVDTQHHCGFLSVAVAKASFSAVVMGVGRGHSWRREPPTLPSWSHHWSRLFRLRPAHSPGGQAAQTALDAVPRLKWLTNIKLFVASQRGTFLFYFNVTPSRKKRQNDDGLKYI